MEGGSNSSWVCLTSLLFQDFQGSSSAGFVEDLHWELIPLSLPGEGNWILCFIHVCVGKLLFGLQAVKCSGGWGLAGTGSRCPLPRLQSVSLGRWAVTPAWQQPCVTEPCVCVPFVPASLFLWDFAAWISPLCEAQLVKREARDRWYHWLTFLICSTDYIQGKKTKPNKPWALAFAGFNKLQLLAIHGKAAKDDAFHVSVQNFPETSFFVCLPAMLFSLT